MWKNVTARSLPEKGISSGNVPESVFPIYLHNMCFLHGLGPPLHQSGQSKPPSKTDGTAVISTFIIFVENFMKYGPSSILMFSLIANTPMLFVYRNMYLQSSKIISR